MLLARGASPGWVGNINPSLISRVYNVANLQTNAAATKAYMGDTTVASAKFAVPWDGGAAPGSGLTRAGRTF